MPRDPVKNRANQTRHRERRRERVNAIMTDVLKYMRRETVLDDFGNMKGYSVTFEAPDDFYDRFEALAREHGRTAKQLMDETMAVYFQEAQRLHDEKN